jgi:iron donor protein CyaY
MDKNEFVQLADETIENIANEIEEADSLYQLEIDFIDGVVNIELQDGKEYVINRHDASSQIWLSSPFSGAHHFSYEDEQWISSDESTLYRLLKEEFKEELDIIL